MPGPEDTQHRADIALAANLLDIVNSGWKSQAICVAAGLGLADRLRNGPLDLETLAASTRCHAPSLLRLLRALVSLGLFAEHDDGTYALAPEGVPLCADADFSVHAWAIWWGNYLWPVWGNLAYSLRTGRSARKLVSRDDAFARMGQDAVMASAFNDAMAELTRLMIPQLIRHYDFSTVRLIVDVGGGRGAMLEGILGIHPEMQGILVDLPHAIESAGQHLAGSAVASRCRFVASDFFEALPAGADVYLLKSILHDWDDERCGAILANCRKAMHGPAKLLLVEHIVESRMEAAAAREIAFSDLNMLVALGGRERTEHEFRALLEAQKLRVSKIIPAGMNFHIIEATAG